MTIAVFTNLGSSLLASGIVIADTQLTVTSTEGALFPAPTAGQHAIIAIEDIAGNVEFVKCTGRTGDTLTIVRAQEGSTARDFASGSNVECRPTAGVMAKMLQKDGGDTLTGTTTLNGTLTLGGSGSIQNGEFTGKLRGTPGDSSNEIIVPTGGGAPTAGGAVILTEDNLVNSLPANAGLLLTGMICFWFGDLGDIPDGFALCDGSAGTPDLRDKFILGGGGALPTSGGSTATSSDGAHDHGAATGSSSPGVAAHSHRMYVWESGSNGPGQMENFGPSGLGPAQGVAGNADTNTYAYRQATEAGHDLVESSAGGGSAHTHTIASGGAHTHVFAPPYRALFAIMKT